MNAELLDKYNMETRKKSLLEEHLERQAQQGSKGRGREQAEGGGEGERKKGKKGKGEGDGGGREGGKKRHKGEKGQGGDAGAGDGGGARGPPGGGGAGEEDWVGKHPWRPFDREKDLEIKPAALNPKSLLENAGGLSGKFKSAGGQRNFL